MRRYHGMKAALLSLASLEPGRYAWARLSALLPPAALRLIAHKQTGGELSWTQRERLRAALTAIEMGVEVTDAARALGWSEFEELVQAILEAWGFRTERHVRLGREELDIVAFRHGICLVLECKRWRRGLAGLRLSSTLQRLAQKARRLAGRLPRGVLVYPAMVSLSAPPRPFVRRIPLVPVSRLDDFLGGLEAYLSGAKFYRGLAGTLA
ncbi:MAG: hypothetical protein C4339_03755 [Nitrososphaerota archaeon]